MKELAFDAGQVPVGGALFEAAYALVARGMLRVGRGDAAQALDDAFAVLRLSRIWPDRRLTDFVGACLLELLAHDLLEAVLREGSIDEDSLARPRVRALADAASASLAGRAPPAREDRGEIEDEDLSFFNVCGLHESAFREVNAAFDRLEIAFETLGVRKLQALVEEETELFEERTRELASRGLASRLIRGLPTADGPSPVVSLGLRAPAGPRAESARTRVPGMVGLANAVTDSTKFPDGPELRTAQGQPRLLAHREIDRVTEGPVSCADEDRDIILKSVRHGEVESTVTVEVAERDGSRHRAHAVAHGIGEGPVPRAEKDRDVAEAAADGAAAGETKVKP